MQQIATCLVVYGVSFLGPMILAEEEDDVFENEDPQPWYRPSLTLEGDIEYTSEKQGPEHQEEWTFDEITLELETDPWESEISIQYETKGAKRGFHVEDLWVKVGTGWELPGWLMVGRTSLPFADFDSLFIEDPLGITLGEIDEEALMLGTESEHVETSIGVFRGEHAGRHHLDGVASAIGRLPGGFHLGLGLVSDLGESVELRERQLELERERREEETGESIEEEDDGDPDDGDAPEPDAGPVVAREIPAGSLVAGWSGLFLEVELEYVTAFRDFPVGILSEEKPVRPETWNVEATLHPFETWSLAARVEGASSFPDAPKFQTGVAIQHVLNENATMTLEWLHAEYREEPNRRLVGAAIHLVF